MSDALTWELVKRNNCFISKNLNGAIFSKEAGNVASKHSFKYSGLANLNNTVGVSEADGVIALSVSSSKKAGKIATSLCKKNSRRSIHAAGAVAASKRPDLKAAAMAKAAAVAGGLRKRKARSA